MQYRMEREAPPQYATMTQLVSAHVERGDADPWNVIREDYPPLHRDHFALAGDYSVAIIRRHPVEFVAKSGPVAAAALTTVNPFVPIAPHGPFAAPLLAINAAITTLMRYGLPFFPLLGAGWLLWMLWWRRKPSVLVEATSTTPGCARPIPRCCWSSSGAAPCWPRSGSVAAPSPGGAHAMPMCLVRMNSLSPVDWRLRECHPPPHRPAAGRPSPSA
jgi:hypothetical protein